MRGTDGRFLPIEEANLHEFFAPLASSASASQNLLFHWSDKRGPAGIPDYLTYSLSRNALATAHSGAPTATPTPLRSLVALRSGKPLAIPQICELTSLDRQTVRSDLRQLASSRLVSMSGDAVQIAPGLNERGTIHAFEAKTNDWRAGLAQALRYTSWADKSTLVLARPPAPLSYERLLQSCKTYQVGLAIQGRWVVRPGRTATAPDQRLWMQVSLIHETRTGLVSEP